MGSITTEHKSSFPKKPVPSGAWDTHHHIFEPDRFPFAEGRHFTPARASLEDLQKFEKSIGVDHVYLDTVSNELLNEYHAAGVRSVRLDFFRHKAMDNVQIQAELMEATAQRLAKWGKPGWSIQIQQPHLEFWPRLRDVVDRSPVPVVVDHCALIAGSSYRVNDYVTNIQDGSYLAEGERIDLAALCETLRNGNLWMKISAPYRCSNLAPGYDDLRWLVRRFVDANPRRVVWGSDWPHTQRHKDRVGKSSSSEEAFLQIDDKAWIESLSKWMSEDEWQLLWVENPATLYDYHE
ncbi:unnamed protein product [Aspergillus oryzae var. brunneus]|uniref:Unnamed protein product n=1 Tax=Aspergillus oryzae var. brunneus TaxID=332754 RepID=A0ABQ6KLD9_ASPOZ|nr:unnamed protein product [Aspergillus oryzae var. brunneus]